MNLTNKTSGSGIATLMTIFIYNFGVFCQIATPKIHQFNLYQECFSIIDSTHTYQYF